jgi:hypothetical protein
MHLITLQRGEERLAAKKLPVARVGNCKQANQQGSGGQVAQSATVKSNPHYGGGGCRVGMGKGAQITRRS